jgi:hypothetical protein
MQKKNTIKEEKGMKNSYHNDMLNLGWELKIKKINEKRLFKKPKK